MYLHEISERISRLSGHAPELDVRIVIQSQGSVGATPSVAVRDVVAGFDWDNGKLLIYPEHALTSLTPDDVAAIRDSVRKGGSWHAYRQYKKQAEHIKALEAELAALRAGQAAKGDSNGSH